MTSDLNSIDPPLYVNIIEELAVIFGGSMDDGIDGEKAIWRGRAVFLAGPCPSLEEKTSDDRLRSPLRPVVKNPQMQREFRRGKIVLPVVPGTVLASSVAYSHPDAADLIKKALPFFDALRHLGARTRHSLASDADQLSTASSEKDREFTLLLDAGFQKEAADVSKGMDRIDIIAGEIDDYPSLAECVIESAQRLLAFVAHADKGVDLLYAGGIVVSKRHGHASSYSNPFSFAQTREAEEDQRWSGVRPREHNSRGSIMSREPGYDLETGGQAMVAGTMATLAILLADLCAERDVTVYVKVTRWYDEKNPLPSSLLDGLATSLRDCVATELRLCAGLSPQQALLVYLRQSARLRSLGSSEIFTVVQDPDFRFSQDFIVEGGRVIISYPARSSVAPAKYHLRPSHELTAEKPIGQRLSGEVRCVASPLMAIQDMNVEGEIKTDRFIAAKLARAARHFARSPRLNRRTLQRVRVACGTDGVTTVTCVRECGTESHFGIPYDRLLSFRSASRSNDALNFYKWMYKKDVDVSGAASTSSSNSQYHPSYECFRAALYRILSRPIGTHFVRHTWDNLEREVDNEIGKKQAPYRRPTFMDLASSAPEREF